MRHATKTATNKDPHWKLEELTRFAAAGPYPNITGMKKLYWGEDALCVKHGAYVFKVDKETYDLF